MNTISYNLKDMHNFQNIQKNNLFLPLAPEPSGPVFETATVVQQQLWGPIPLKMWGQSSTFSSIFISIPLEIRSILMTTKSSVLPAHRRIPTFLSTSLCKILFRPFRMACYIRFSSANKISGLQFHMSLTQGLKIRRATWLL